MEVRDGGIDGVLFDGDSWDDELGCCDYVAEGILRAVSEVLSRGMGRFSLLTTSSK